MSVSYHDENGTFNSFPIALVVSLYNEDITAALKQGALEQLAFYGFQSKDIKIVEVPGAVEIPITAQRLAMKETYGAIVALGAVVRGETSHYDSVCELVAQGCLRVALTFNIPVIFGVLTTENEAQAWDRLGGAHGHKGRESVDCAVAMYHTLKHI
jgi:6,7-dimethyl-8-ribityllumazine synthase